MLNKFISDGSLTAVGQLTFMEANSRGDDILIYQQNENGERVHVETFYGLRQQVCNIIKISGEAQRNNVSRWCCIQAHDVRLNVVLSSTNVK